MDLFVSQVDLTMRLFICRRHSQLLQQGCRRYVVMCVSLASSWARLRQPCDRCRKSCDIDANHYIRASSLAHEAASVSRFERILHKRDYPGMFLDHNDYQKTLFVKSDMHVLSQEAYQVPQGSPMGPKFLVQKFSHTILE